MNNPQERIIKKMIDNIVEQNKPVFERAASVPSEAGTPASASHAQPSSEDMGIVSRKLEYGFNSMRAENAELRKQLDEIGGAVKMLRNDMDGLRMTLQQQARSGSAPRHEASTQGHAAGVGAPQYRKTEADEAYEQTSGEASNEESEHMPKVQQARGFAKKDPNTDIDIGKVFYYGKK